MSTKGESACAITGGSSRERVESAASYCSGGLTTKERHIAVCLQTIGRDIDGGTPRRARKRMAFHYQLRVKPRIAILGT